MINEDANTEVIEPSLGQETDVANVDPESSPGSGDNHEDKSNGVQKRINELTAKRYEAERKAEDLQAKLSEMEASKPAATMQNAPEAPVMPSDIYDEEAMKAYHAGMVQYSQDVATAVNKNSFQEYQNTIAEQAKQAESQKLVSSYANNAVRDGVDIEKLRLAENTLNQAGISHELGGYIMRDANGGKITEYLYDNPAIMHEILSMDPVSAGIKIATEVKTAALSTTPKVSGAPEPLPEITGGGMVEKDEFSALYPGTTFN